MSGKKKKYFYYDNNGKLETRYSNVIFVASEVVFPSRTVGDCVNRYFKVKDQKIPIRKKIDLVFGDPIELKGCVLISKNAKDAPWAMQQFEMAEVPHKIFKFRYKRKHFWACESTRMRLAY